MIARAMFIRNVSSAPSRLLYRVFWLSLAVLVCLPAVAQGQAGSTLTKPVQVLVQLDLRQSLLAHDPPEGIGLLGNQRPLGWAIPQDLAPLTDEDGDGIWYTTITFPAGSSTALAFSMAFKVDGTWNQKRLPGQRTHAVLLNGEHETQQLSLRLDRGRLVSVEESSLDDYAAILDAVGEAEDEGRFAYYRAVDLLEQGQDAAAEVVYARGTVQRAGEPVQSRGYQDDFSLLKLKAQARQGAWEGAVAEAEQKEQAATEPDEQARFALAQGEMLQQAGQGGMARAVFQRTLRRYLGKAPEQALDARMARIESYLAEADSAEIGLARLEAWSRGTSYEADQQVGEGGPVDPALSFQPADEQMAADWQRRALQRLSLAYLKQGQLEDAVRAYRELSRQGTPRQRAQARFDTWQLQLRQGEAARVLAEADALLGAWAAEGDSLAAAADSLGAVAESSLATWGETAEEPDPEATLQAFVTRRVLWHSRALYLRAQALRHLGRVDEAEAAWQDLIERYPKGPYAEPARQYLADARADDSSVR